MSRFKENIRRNDSFFRITIEEKRKKKRRKKEEHLILLAIADYLWAIGFFEQRNHVYEVMEANFNLRSKSTPIFFLSYFCLAALAEYLHLYLLRPERRRKD